MNALSLMQWLLSWGHCLIFETRLRSTLVDGPVAELDRHQRKFIKDPTTVYHKQCSSTCTSSQSHLLLLAKLTPRYIHDSSLESPSLNYAIVTYTDPSRDFHHSPGVVAALPDDEIQFVIPKPVL